MIFSSKNEDGIPAWRQVLNGTKTVTRRVKPQPVGAIRAVQPGRTKKGVGFIKILSCMDSNKWERKNLSGYGGTVTCSEEAHKEGFKTWEGLWEWIYAHVKRPLPKLYRIEFVLIPKIDLSDYRKPNVLVEVLHKGIPRVGKE